MLERFSRHDAGEALLAIRLENGEAIAPQFNSELGRSNYLAAVGMCDAGAEKEEREMKSCGIHGEFLSPIAPSVVFSGGCLHQSAATQG